MADRDDLLPPFKGEPSKDCSKRLLDDLGRFSTYVEQDYGVREVRWQRPATGGLTLHFKMSDGTKFHCEFTEWHVEQVQAGLQYQTFFRQMDSGLRAHVNEWIRQRKAASAASSPDIGEYIVGYRQWKLGENSTILHPVSRGRTWVTGDWSEAICDRANEHGVAGGRHAGFFVPTNVLAHVAPDPNCECGLYALHTPTSRTTELAVTGAVIAKGLIEVHDTGFRAQYAKPVIFCLPELKDVPGEETLRAATATVHRLAKAHGVQAVPEKNLVSAAQEWGRPLPPSEYPSNHASDFFM